MSTRAHARLVTGASTFLAALCASAAISLLLAGPAEALSTPSLTSIASTNTIVGLGVFDHVTLSGGANPTGSIAFSLFGPNNPACTGAAAFTTTVPVNGDGDYDSARFTTATAGTYQWVASYSGDANNNPAGPTACADPTESVIVSKVTGVITTTASPTVATGGKIHDTAKLSGDAPTGTISFRLSGPGDTFCGATPVFTATVPVNAGSGIYDSPDFTPTVAGTYRWQTSYDGDANNQAITRSSCLDPAESVVVTAGAGLGAPVVTTSASGTVAFGGAISDTAVLSGGSSPTGKIAFAAFGPDDSSCTGAPAFSSMVVVSGDGSYSSGSFTPAVAGTYRFTAAYSGDAGNAVASSGCGAAGESVVVGTGTAVLTTQASDAARLGGQLTDTATLRGGASPTGLVTFRLFGPTDPTCAGTAVFTSVKAIGSSRSVTSNVFIPASPGTYRWLASYGGDSNGAPISATCADANESTLVSRAQPTLATSTPPTVAAGASSSDMATLAGGIAPTGALRFELFGPNDPTCSSPVYRATAVVSGNGGYTSGPSTLVAQGHYSWVVTYGGDTNNLPAATLCQSETVDVPPPTATATTPTGTTPTIATPASPTPSAAQTITQICAAVEGQVDAELPGQTISSVMRSGFSFGLSAPASIEVRLVLRAKDPASGSFISLANLLLHVSNQVTAAQADNGLGTNYARRARAFLAVSERAGATLLVFKVVHCRPDKQLFSAESVGTLSLAP